MLTNFFGKSKPINSLLVFTLFLLLFVLAFLNGKTPFEWSIFPWFILLFGIVNFIISKNNLTFGNSYAFLFFVLLLGFFPKVISINTLFYANVTLLLFLRKVYSLQSPKKLVQKLFDAGMWLGVSFLIAPFLLLFSILLFAAIFLYKRSTIQAVLTPVLGFFAPVFLYFTYCFWFDKTAMFNKLFSWFTDYDFNLYQQNNYLIPLIFVIIFVLMSIFIKTPKALAVKNRFRSSWLVLLLNFLLAVIVVALTDAKDGSELLYIVFPSAVILANGLELYQKKWIGDVVLILFFIGAVTMCFTTF